MTERDAGHHGEDHSREHADGQCVQPIGREAGARQQPGSLEREAHYDPAIAEMEDPEDWLARRFHAMPTRQPRCMEQSARERDDTGRPRIGRN